MLLNHAGLTQDPEVVRGGGLADRQLEDAARLVVKASCELAYDLSPHRIGQGGKYRIQMQLAPAGVGKGAHV